MFLTTDNQLKVRKMIVAGIITAILAVFGIAFFDKPLFLFLRNFDCPLWAWFDEVFSAKIWIISAFVAVLLFCVKKYLNSNACCKNEKNKFSVPVVVCDFFAKMRASYAVLIFSSVVSAGIIVKVLKVLIGRARPVFFEALGQTGFYPLNWDWAFNSMPSGHTAVSFAGLVMIGMLAPRYKVLTWTLATVIGFSRIAIGAHWPSDVIFGAFIGMVVADVVKWFLLNKTNK